LRFTCQTRGIQLQVLILFSTIEDPMGRSLLIVLFGFAASFGILAYSKDSRMLESVDRVVGRVENYSTKNTATSGAYMVLNKLYQTPGWRTGYTNVYFGGDSLSVAVDDNSTDPGIDPNYVRIFSTSSNAGSADTTQVMVYDGRFNEFAVWSKDSVNNVTTQDSLGNPNPGLLMQDPPYMPEIDKTALVNAATSQGNVKPGPTFNPPANYPNGDFYVSGVPNVTHVLGDMDIPPNQTIYGIYVVEGDVTFQLNATLYGVIYQPNAGSTVDYSVGVGIALIRGGVVTWGDMNGGITPITVRYKPEYLNAFLSNYAPYNPPMRVLSWESWNRNPEN
jgi:hypothetical protein